MSDLTIIQNNEVVTTSLQVATNFEKNHRDVLKSIDDLIEKGVAQNVADLFKEGTYTHFQNKQEYRMFYINRDGFTLLAMGFSGQKALTWKMKYIESFNKMENHIKQQLDTSQLSPELQMFDKLFKTLASQELETKKLESKIDDIKDVVALNVTNWREESRKLINKIAMARGGMGAYKEVTNDIYDEVERRGKCDLNRRLENAKQRLAYKGVAKSKINKVNKVDMIGNEQKLIEVYMAVVKDFAIKQGVTIKEEL